MSGQAPPGAAGAPRLRLARAAGVTAGLTAAGTVLGLVRDRTIADLFGAGAESDAFLVAWTLPEIAATVLIEDAMALVMVPAFSGVLARGEDVRELVRGTLPRLLGVLAVLTATLAACAPQLVHALAPGLPDPATATACTRLTALTLFTFGLAGYLSATLRAHHRYLPPAAVYVAYNAGIVATLLVLHGRWGVRAAAAGVAVGGALMVAVQLPAAAALLRPHPRSALPCLSRATPARRRAPAGDAPRPPAPAPAPAPHGPGRRPAVTATRHTTLPGPTGDPQAPGTRDSGRPAPVTDPAVTATRHDTHPATTGDPPAPAPHSHRAPVPASGLYGGPAGSGVRPFATGHPRGPAYAAGPPAPAAEAPRHHAHPGRPGHPGHGRPVPAAFRDERRAPDRRATGARTLPVRAADRDERPGRVRGLAAPATGRPGPAAPAGDPGGDPGGVAPASRRRQHTLPLALLAPVLLFTLGRQAQVLVERFFAAGLPAGAISHLNYAQKVAQVPMVLSLMVCTVTFPSVSRDLAAGERARARKRVERDVTLACVVVLIGSAYVVACAPQLTRMLFQRGEFDAADTWATAGVMRVYALGLLGQSLVGALVRPYFSAGGPGWGPAGAMAAGLGVTAAVDAGAVAVFGVFGVYGIAAGNAAGITVTAVLLLRGLGARGVALRARVLAPRLAVVGAAAAAATGAGWAVASRVPGEPAAAGAGALAVCAVFAGVIAVAAAAHRPPGSASARHRETEARP